MNVIALARYLAAVAEIAGERPAYRLGGDGSDGTCDCIGLLIGALKRCGERWGGIHGSNWAARNAMRTLLPVTEAGELCLGDAVFKARTPGNARYALPSRYRKHPDRRDYYHVGVVTSVSPLAITHCTSPGGMKVDTALGSWSFRGALAMVATDGKEVDEMRKATVTAENGSTVKMREKPSASCKVYWHVPVGAQVELLDWEGDWAHISYNGAQGYMMRKFLHPEGEEETEAPEYPQAVPEGADMVQVPRVMVEQIISALESVVGRG